MTSSVNSPPPEAPGYTETALHFDVEQIPPVLLAALPPGPLALADLGCGDGPLFMALTRDGHIGPDRPVWGVDLEAPRLERVHRRFPHVSTLVAPADAVPTIASGSLDFVISTMVMEHVPDEVQYLDEVRRLLRPGGRTYLTTVFKRCWAWYFRKRNGESVLDTSHLREYGDLEAFRDLVMGGGRFRRLLTLELEPMWFPILDPLLFRLAQRSGLGNHPGLLRLLRAPRLPIPGYFAIHVVLEA